MGTALAAAIALTGQAGAARAATTSATTTTQEQAQTTTFALVTIHGKEIMRLTDAGGRGAESRALEVDKRLRDEMESQPGRPAAGPIKPSQVTVQKSGSNYVVRLRDANVITAAATDAKLAGKTPQALAEQWATDLRDALSGVEVTAKEDLPKDFVTFAMGQITMPAGGGAGTGAKPKAKAPAKPKGTTPAKPHDAEGSR
jgi:hypothetical protein